LTWIKREPHTVVGDALEVDGGVLFAVLCLEAGRPQGDARRPCN
jgi:hypothetical protein